MPQRCTERCTWEVRVTRSVLETFVLFRCDASEESAFRSCRIPTSEMQCRIPEDPRYTTSVRSPEPELMRVRARAGGLLIMSQRALLHTLRAGAAVIVGVALASGAWAKDDEHGKRRLGPGCAPDRPAVAHHAAAAPVKNARGRAPVPCVTAMGVPTSEVAIAVSNAGTLLVQPAVETVTGFPLGVLRSDDDGASWDLILPSNFDNPPRITAVDQDIFVDRETGRLFWLMGRPGGTTQTPRLDISDDDGVTWFQSPQPPIPLDHSQLFAGRPPKSLKSKMRGYPNVLYACQGNFPQMCQASFDGGMSFEPAVAIPVPPEAGASCRSWGLRGAVDQKGTVYIPTTPCQRPYVAISRDAGQTWQHVLIANRQEIGFGELSLAMDTAQNLYAAWVDSADRLPYLAISRDGGLHWGAPQMIAPPGVNEAGLPHVTAGAAGKVSVSYY